MRNTTQKKNISNVIVEINFKYINLINVIISKIIIIRASATIHKCQKNIKRIMHGKIAKCKEMENHYPRCLRKYKHIPILIPTLTLQFDA